MPSINPIAPAPVRTYRFQDTLATIASGGALNVLGGNVFVDVSNSGTFIDNGLLYLGSSTFGANLLNVGPGGMIAGSGTILSAIADAGVVAAMGGTLIVSGAVSGTGVLSAAAGSVLDFTGGGAFTQTIVGAGTLRLDGAFTLNPGPISIAAIQVDTQSVVAGVGCSRAALSMQARSKRPVAPLLLRGPSPAQARLRRARGRWWT